MEELSKHSCFGGTLGYYKHASSVNNCDMRFSLFLPPKKNETKSPLLIYLAGLTCTEETFPIKAHAFKSASELGIAIVSPDTSPRGDNVPDEQEWDIGQGAGFYIDATEAPWSNNYNMYSYITEELMALIKNKFPIDTDRKGIFGHSMGGHGALTIYLKNPDQYKSVSAFAPICSPKQVPWGQKAFTKYLGLDKTKWDDYDASELMRRSDSNVDRPEILIDQGLGDQFLEQQLKPHIFVEACEAAGQRVKLRQHEKYDHGYFFIQTFMNDHLQHHGGVL